MSAFIESPYPTLSFGDVCSGFPWFDASLRADATALRRETAPKAFAEKRGVDRIDFMVPADGDAIPLPKTTDYVLAHGMPFSEAACLSDDCAIETALGREGREPRGQLLFAPVTELREDEAGALQNNFRRHPIDDRVIELHRTFRVKATDIAESLGGLERRSLTNAARSALAARWAAHACRTGPLVATDNANKVAQLLIQDGWDEQRAAEAAQSLADVTALSWLFESKGLEGAGEEHDEHRGELQDADISTAMGGIRESLEQLRDKADQALSLLP